MILIKYNKKAITDLENIYLKISEDKKSIANKFIHEINEFILLLKINPEMGKDCQKKGLKQDCRILFYRNYTILYKINKTHISIKRVINTKQNYKG